MPQEANYQAFQHLISDVENYLTQAIFTPCGKLFIISISESNNINCNTNIDLLKHVISIELTLDWL